ncbi:CRE-SRR-5 protein [Caenorhabditis remanei]|uniref:CRE-SRR-5 protein n=1 Tax=Caenorhabditis remanei TaxID=31234 RepID=E3LNY6_CAERE|nr:CRE-SRR-5 protein [Caenorhabditis remanei]
MFSSNSEVVKVPPGSFCIQVPEVKEPLTDDKFLGPLSFFIRFTGLDCSIVALSKVDSRFKLRAWITQIFAIIIMAIIVLRCFTFFQLHGHSMSFQWAESGMFAFLGVQSVECAYCIFSWTRNDFIMNHLEKLEVLRLLRVKDNEKIDSYCSIHLKILVWTGLWTLITMAHAVNCAIEEKVILSGDHIYPIIFYGMPFVTLLVCFHVSIFLNCYFLVNCSLYREIEYFNTELENAQRMKQLNNPDLMAKYSNRQAELIHLVRSANKSLGGYTFTTPISMFNACINAIYIFFSFREELPLISGVIMTLNIFATIFMTYFSIRPASNVQFHIQDTSRILMESREFENSKDADVMNTYHVMIDRSLRHTARLRVLGGIPIYPTTFHIAIFFIPSLGTLLSFVKKSLHTYGLEMHK